MGENTWYVAETLPRAELLAEQNLLRQGFGAFCPRFRKVRRHARRIDHVLAPVFPGYVFVRFDRFRDQWRSINGTMGVKALVGASSCQPQAMPEIVIQELQARCHAGIMTCILPQLQPGQQVRVASGPFADRLATIEHLDDKGRVRILLDILGGTVPLRLSTSELVQA